MNTLSTQFESELGKLITAEIETIKDNMVAGSYADPSAYNRHVGAVYAYRRVMQDLASEANKILTER